MSNVWAKVTGAKHAIKQAGHNAIHDAGAALQGTTTNDPEAIERYANGAANAADPMIDSGLDAATGKAVTGTAGTIMSAVGTVWKGFRKGSLAEHFARHGGEFGDITQVQYLKMAKDFAGETGDAFRTGQVGNIFVKYDPATERVLIGNVGTREIRTFYKADGRDADAFEAAMQTAREKVGEW